MTPDEAFALAVGELHEALAVGDPAIAADAGVAFARLCEAVAAQQGAPLTEDGRRALLAAVGAAVLARQALVRSRLN